ncbi:UbiA prenyltransferase [Diaporthe helianthi]|uniref:UbiA prenyltransferase n=1 Tax=Diaporthe helianthi TaxID=158607 RepID=A0A2P5IEN9_DIAHE|nr:UbiA prenyltransferase [Diaporthe helianthi]
MANVNVESVKHNRRTLWYKLETLYLFTKGDFKSIVVPHSIFAISVVFSKADLLHTAKYEFNPGRILTRIPLMIFWLWIHLLVEDISNQRLPGGIAEDTLNKPWRPIPSGRLSAEEAQQILRVLVPLALLTSTVLSSSRPSATLMTLVWLYNDLDAANAGPMQRNMLNAAGLACFGWGALTTLIGSSEAVGGNTVLICWIALTAAVVMTTIHAQDFPDVAGDKARGRKTIPLVFNEVLARATLAFLVLFWSVVCLVFWDVKSPMVWVAMLGMAGAMSLKTVLGRTLRSDKLVWRLWCYWMSFLYLLPVFSTGCVMSRANGMRE